MNNRKFIWNSFIRNRNPRGKKSAVLHYSAMGKPHDIDVHFSLFVSFTGFHFSLGNIIIAGILHYNIKLNCIDGEIFLQF